MKTTNAGTSWNNQTIIDRPDNFAGIYCTGLSEGVIIGRAGTAGVVYKYKPTLLVFPNGNQTLLTNFICDIKWICDVEQNVKIEYTTNDGANWITIINSIQGSIGHYYWTIPPNASTQCKVKVTNLNNPNYYDESNSTFTIALPIRNAQLLKDTVITELPCYVNVLFHSLDQNNVGIENLFKEEFKIQEDNVQISPNESRLQIGKANVLNYTYKSVLLLDNSTSISPLDLQIIKQGAIGFVRNKLPAQQIALYVFSENTILLQDFTTDTTALINSINSIQLGLPSTNLYGSLITGLSRWQDRYDLNNFEFGNLVVLTDGEDTQGSSTLQQVLNARKNKRVVTIGLGNQINPGILQQIGNAGFYQVTNINLLISNFILIQQNFIKFLNSFYWLNYTSPKRGNNNHVLKVSLFNNQNTDTTSYITAVFNSNGFYSVIPGIVVNATPTNPYGVDTIFIPANANVLVTIETPFTFNRQPYQFLIANPQLLNIQPGGTPTQFRFLGTAQPGLNTNVIINDTANGYTKTLHVEFGPVGINTISSAVPDKFSLSQNYPNPFNPSTKIKFDISTTSLVKINLFDIIGREIEGLVNEILTPGSYEIILNSNNLSSGIYYYKIEAKDFIKTKKMILLK